MMRNLESLVLSHAAEEANREVVSGLSPALLAENSHGRLRFNMVVPYQFNFEWFRETGYGEFRGLTGLVAAANEKAGLTVELEGSFETAIMRDRGCWHAVVRKRAGSANPAVRVAVTVPEEDDEGFDGLLGALLGVHPVEWAWTALNDVGSIRWKGLTEAAGASTHEMEKLSKVWSAQSARTVAAIWDAAGEAVEMDRLARVVERTAADCSPEQIAELVGMELVNSVFFQAGPAGRWLEAAMGQRPTLPVTPAAARRLKSAARVLVEITGSSRMRSILGAVRRLAAGELNPDNPSQWTIARLAESLGGDLMAGNAAARERIRVCLAAWRELSRRIASKAGESIQKTLELEIAALTGEDGADAVLADVSVPAGTAGEAMLNSLADGDLSAAVAASRGGLASGLARVVEVNVELPALNRWDWRHEIHTVMAADVNVNGAGRVFLTCPEEGAIDASSHRQQSARIFVSALAARDKGPLDDIGELSFTGAWMVGQANEGAWREILRSYGIAMPRLMSDEARATLTLKLPASAAKAWSTTPHSRETSYYPTIGRMSRAMQQALRHWVPALHFTHPDKYQIVSVAYPLLVYQYSQPRTALAKREMCYDYMDPAMLARAARTASRRLEENLKEIERMLFESGRPRIAVRYRPTRAKRILQSVLSQKRNIRGLLAHDDFLVEEAIHLADSTRELRSIGAEDTKTTSKRLWKHIDGLAKALQKKLRFFYAGGDYIALGAMLLIEATAALAGTPERPAVIEATLEWEERGARRFLRNTSARCA